MFSHPMTDVAERDLDFFFFFERCEDHVSFQNCVSGTVLTVLQIRRGKKNNQEIIFRITPLKPIL